MTRGAAAALAAAAIAAAACGPANAPGVSRPVRIAISSDLSTTDFLRASDRITRRVAELVSDPLVAFDERMEIVPAAADEWEWNEGHTVLTFHLSPSARWSDGRPVSSADVVHTWRRVTDPVRGDPSRAVDFRAVTAVEAPDERTVVVRYARPFAPALAAWARLPLAAAHADPERFPPVGCGPYRLARWEREQRIVLEANAEHHRSPPRVKELVLEVLPEYATRLKALRAGEIDATSLSPSQFRKVSRDPEFGRRFRVIEYRTLYVWFIAWRMDGSNPFFADRRVRRAMTMAIDRQGFLDALGDHASRVAVSTFHPDTWAYDPDVAPLPYDAEKAASLLAEAGWRDADGDGVLEKGGRSFRFPLLFAAGSAEVERIALFVQDNLAKVGVAVELAPLEWAVLRDRLQRRQFVAAMSGMGLEPDPDPYDLWHSSQAAAGLNYPGLADPQVDRLIERARTSFDRAERAALYRALQRRLHGLAPCTFFFYPASRLAVARGLELRTSPRGLFGFRPGPAAWHWTAGSPP